MKKGAGEVSRPLHFCSKKLSGAICPVSEQLGFCGFGCAPSAVVSYPIGAPAFRTVIAGAAELSITQNAPSGVPFETLSG